LRADLKTPLQQQRSRDSKKVSISERNGISPVFVKVNLSSNNARDNKNKKPLEFCVSTHKNISFNLLETI